MGDNNNSSFEFNIPTINFYARSSNTDINITYNTEDFSSMSFSVTGVGSGYYQPKLYVDCMTSPVGVGSYTVDISSVNTVQFQLFYQHGASVDYYEVISDLKFS